jgi:hypothetical protein
MFPWCGKKRRFAWVRLYNGSEGYVQIAYLRELRRVHERRDRMDSAWMRGEDYIPRYPDVCS